MPQLHTINCCLYHLRTNSLNKRNGFQVSWIYAIHSKRTLKNGLWELKKKTSQEQQDLSEIPLQSVELNEANQTEDNIKPDDSVSNAGSHKTFQSQRSSTFSARLKAEAEAWKLESWNSQDSKHNKWKRAIKGSRWDEIIFGKGTI